MTRRAVTAALTLALAGGLLPALAQSPTPTPHPVVERNAMCLLSEPLACVPPPYGQGYARGKWRVIQGQGSQND